MDLTESNQNLVLGIFLLILAVSGNFVAETLSCKTQKLLSESMLAKNLVIILVIYFALGITGDEVKRPDQLLLDTLKVYTFFLIFNKMDQPFVMAVFVMIAGLLILYNYRDYFIKSEKEEVADHFSTYINYLMIAILIATVVGFALYFNKQYGDYKGSFSFVKFIFGKTTCASMKTA